LTVGPKDDADEVSLYKTESKKPLEDKTKEDMKTVAIGPGNFSTTNLLGGSSGISDVTVMVMGKSIGMPFSMINEWLRNLGYVLQAVTFLLCARIVARG